MDGSTIVCRARKGERREETATRRGKDEASGGKTVIVSEPEDNYSAIEGRIKEKEVLV